MHHQLNILIVCSPTPDKEPKVNLDAMDTIGTWGHRVIRFGPDKKASTPTHIPGTPEEPEIRPRSARSQAQKKFSAKSEQLERCTSNDSEAAAVNAAWRWRFNRRWRTEQVENKQCLSFHLLPFIGILAFGLAFQRRLRCLLCVSASVGLGVINKDTAVKVGSEMLALFKL